MKTITQLIQRRLRRNAAKLIKTSALKLTCRKISNKNKLPKKVFSKILNPQLRGRCLSVSVIAPKKPNSAQRLIARVRLSNLIYINCYIPGKTEGHGLQKSSSVLVRGGRTQDLVGVHYKVIRGKLDCAPTVDRKTSRSKYGVKHWGRLKIKKKYFKNIYVI